jgi:glutaredoxin
MGAGSSAPAAEMSSAVAATISRRIAQSKVVIYSKTSCPYCHMAKKVIFFNGSIKLLSSISFLQVFKDLNQEYDLIELDQVPDGSNIQDELGKMTGARTVI